MRWGGMGWEGVRLMTGCGIRAWVEAVRVHQTETAYRAAMGRVRSGTPWRRGGGMPQKRLVKRDGE